MFFQRTPCCAGQDPHCAEAQVAESGGRESRAIINTAPLGYKWRFILSTEQMDRDEQELIRIRQTVSAFPSKGVSDRQKGHNVAFPCNALLWSQAICMDAVQQRDVFQ